MGGQSSAPSGLANAAAWKGLRKGNQVHGMGFVCVTGSFVGPDLTSVASARAPLVFGGGSLGAFQVVDAYVRSSGTITQHATDGAGIYIRNVGADGTGTDNLSDAPGYSTLTAAGGTMTAAVSNQITIDGPESTTPKNVYTLETAKECIEVFIDKLGGGVDMSNDTLHFTLWLRLSRPSE